MEELFPSFDEFSKRFVELTYTKSDNPVNIKTKYALNKLNCFYAEKELFFDDGSIEHILPESEKGTAVNIGNLILLEQKTNEKINNLPYTDKVSFYQQSAYPWIQKFASENDKWSEEKISKRATELAKIYYTKIFERQIIEA